MQFPLALFDVSLLIALLAIILLITSEIISPYYGKKTILIKNNRLKTVALILGFVFIITIFIRIYLG